MTEHRDIHSMATVREEQARRDKHQRRLLRTYLPELVQLERTLTEAPPQFSAQVETRIHTRELDLPLYRIEIGQPAKDRPVFLLVDRKSTRLNSSHVKISYAVFCLKK